MRFWLVVVVLLAAFPVRAGNLAKEWSYELAQEGYEGHDELLALLESDEDKTLRYKASYLLGRQGRSEDAQAIAERIPEEVWSERERVGLAGHVMRLDVNQGTRITLRLLEQLEGLEARAKAMDLLAKHGLAPRYQEIVKTAKTPDWGARKHAINALGHLANREYAKTLEPPPLEVLTTLAGVDEKWARWQAVLNLGLVLRQAEGAERRAIARVLCERKRKDPTEEVRAKANSALEQESIECESLSEDM